MIKYVNKLKVENINEYIFEIFITGHFSKKFI